MSTPKEIFEKLGRDYELEDKMIEYLTADTGLGATSLKDFMYGASSEDGVEKMVKAAKVNNEIRQTSKLRQAWVAAREAAAEEREVKRKGLDENDLDALLTQPQLDDIEQTHWRRYKMVWPAELALD